MAEGAGLENRYTLHGVSGVRIPLLPQTREWHRSSHCGAFFVPALPPPSTFGHFPKDEGISGTTFGIFPKDTGVLGTTFGIFPKDAGVSGTTFGIFPKDEGISGTTFGHFPKDTGVSGTTFGHFPKDAAEAAAEG